MSNASIANFSFIASESDFNDFTKYEPINRLMELEVRLASAVRTLAGSRTAVTEFLERRLSQIRLVLANA